MDMEKNKGIKTFDELVELEHGKIGTENRNKDEDGVQMFSFTKPINKLNYESTTAYR